MKQTFIALAALSLLTAGCTQNDIEETLRKEGSLSFSLAMAGATNTRAAELTATALQADGNGVALWAYHSASQALYFSDRLTWQNNSEWNTTDHIRFMPVGGSLDFYAIHPAGAGTNFAHNGTAAALTYTVPTPSQADLVAATVLGSSTAAVALKAHHLLSQVNFAVAGGSNKEIAITSIALNGVHSAATFTFNPTATAAGAWGAHTATKANYTYAVAGSGVGGNVIPADALAGTYYVLGDGGKWAVGPDALYWNSAKAGGADWDAPANIAPANNPKNALMLMPQNFASNPDADIQIEYTINGMEGDPQLIPLSSLVDWQAGKRYVYVIEFSNDDPFEFEIEVLVEDWDDRELEVDIEPDPYLDITNVEVSAYDAAATRVYFYTNLPATEVFIDPSGNVSTPTGTSFSVQSEFYAIANDDTDGTHNFHFDAGTRKGYLDIINRLVSSAGDIANKGKNPLVLKLRAGKLVRTITVHPVVTTEAAKLNTQPYIGTFHRHAQTGERIVTWNVPEITEWTATIQANASYAADVAELVIDRLASPDYADNALFSPTVRDAEGAKVAHEMNGAGATVRGKGRVYFRVGWKTPSPAPAKRFAVITVTGTNVGGSGVNSVDIYCRQGETEGGGGVSNVTYFAVYNTHLPLTFTQYPSQVGMLYNWNLLAAWDAVGSNAPAAYPRNNWNDWDYERSACPEGYLYPDEAARTEMTAVLGGNSTWGYYADGYFDRRAVSLADHRVDASTLNVAAAGVLFFAPPRSVFFPTGGYRYGETVSGIRAAADNGRLTQPGRYGGYWTDLVTDTDRATATMLHQGATSADVAPYHKLHGFNLRCIKASATDTWIIRFDANGGENTPNTLTVPTGAGALDIPTTLPVGYWKDGYDFKGWSTTKDGTGTTYLLGETYSTATIPAAPAAGTHTLYAKWVLDPNTYIDFRNYMNATQQAAYLLTGGNSHNGHTAVSNGATFANQTAVMSATTGEKAYSKLAYSPLWPAATWADAYATCKLYVDRDNDDAGTWRLPRAAELILIGNNGDSYGTGLKGLGSILSATPYHWAGTSISGTNAFRVALLAAESANKSLTYPYRCVKELPLN